MDDQGSSLKHLQLGQNPQLGILVYPSVVIWCPQAAEGLGTGAQGTFFPLDLPGDTQEAKLARSTGPRGGGHLAQLWAELPHVSKPSLSNVGTQKPDSKTQVASSRQSVKLGVQGPETFPHSAIKGTGC